MLCNPNLRRALLGALVACAVLGLAAPAAAQSRRRPPPQNPPTQPPPGQTQPPPGQPQGQPPAQPQTQPGQPATPGQPGAPGVDPWADLKPSPSIKRMGQPKRWTVTAFTRIGSRQEIKHERGGDRLEYDVWEFDAATLVYPVVGETASSVLEVWGPPDKEEPAVTGEVQLNDHTISDELTIVTQGIGGGLLPCATWRAQWQVPYKQGTRYTARELDFEVSISQACYETKLDDRAASQVEWPKGPWPPEAASTFQPQMFVDFDMQGRGYDMSAVTALLDTWSEGRSIEEMRKQSKPLMLAKWLAGQTVEHVQISGEGFTFDRDTGLWEGFDTPGAAAAAIEGRGTELDLPCLLVAIYRAVGLPARLVIGYNKGGEGKNIYLEQKEGPGSVRVWVEFALYDEANKTFGWVPVDVVEMRRTQSRMPPNYLNSSLRYFGTHPDLDEMVPLAFHFHPPTTVRAYGAPALWGWFVTPTPPERATQTVRFNVNSTPRGGSNESHLPAEKTKTK